MMNSRGSMGTDAEFHIVTSYVKDNKVVFYERISGYTPIELIAKHQLTIVRLMKTLEEEAKIEQIRRGDDIPF